MKTPRTISALFVLALLLPVPAAAAAGVDPALLAGMKARAIGPAAMSGRVVALAGVPGDPPTLYVGSASGGLWRSTDGGAVWEPLFDEQPVASIGAIVVDPSAPDVLWVGTG
ncbi:MAG: WD40/YVTN/BNR-like repeat-containing protein, partial [Anaerolineales bacterium]